MTKFELRNWFLAERNALATDEVAYRSQQITDQFFTFFAEKFADNSPITLHTFLPILHRNEVDTWGIARTIWTDFPHTSLSTSVTDFQSNSLSHRLLAPETELVENRWGIPEPTVNSPAILPTQIDLVLVPLLVFDRQGHRVGYGGGFYDRFLAQCRPDCLKIGLSFFEPIEAIDDIEPTDVPLTHCVTPLNVYSFMKI